MADAQVPTRKDSSQQTAVARASAPAFALVNPPASQLGLRNAVYSGTNTRHETGEVPGWLSIKTVIAGSAVWETPERRFVVDESSYLILNDRHRYSLSFESTTPVATFVLFFKRGLAEDVLHCCTNPTERLLDEPAGAKGVAEFFERIETRASPLFGLLERFRRRVTTGIGTDEAETWFARLAEQMVREQRGMAHEMARLPAVRASTRSELYRRLRRGRDFLLSNAGERTTLDDAARAACLSPYHFHRAFKQAFGETPHQTLTRHRLARAAVLLAAGDSVTNACLATGFESVGSFSSLFRRHYRVPPRDYRKRPPQ